MPAFFRRKSKSSIQDKIDALKNQSSRDEPKPSRARDELTEEERQYLELMRETLSGPEGAFRKAVKASPTPHPAPPPPLTRHATPIPVEPEPEPESDSEPEKEVERLIHEGLLKRAPKVYTLEGGPETQAANMPSGSAAAPDTVPEEDNLVTTDEYEAQGGMPHPPGTICALDNGAAIIIRREIPDKNYDLVYILGERGKVEPRGICLADYVVHRLGRLPREELALLERTMAWRRDRLVFHLDNIDYADNIPFHSTPTPSFESGQSEQEDDRSLRRGRKICIAMSGRTWEAIYWGRDSEGSIVVYQENGGWRLRHMDLERFGDALQTGDLTPPAEMREIEANVAHTTTSGGAVANQPPAADASGGAYERGRKLTVRMGDREWSAVYWSREGGVDLLAWSEKDAWKLTRLDLSLYKDMTRVGELLPPGQIRVIEESLKRR